MISLNQILPIGISKSSVYNYFSDYSLMLCTCGNIMTPFTEWSITSSSLSTIKQGGSGTC